jgi:hypothetical protein
MDIDNILFSIGLIIILLVIIILIILLLSKYSNLDILDSEENHAYYVQTPAHADGKNMNYCLPGCVRGTCQKTKNKNSCRYDFQCQYCQDSNTNMFYVNFDDERTIVPLYEEEEGILTDKQENLLNDSIKENNIYIRQLNNKIRILNS